MKALYALVLAAAATGLTVPALADTAPYQTQSQAPDVSGRHHDKSGAKMSREEKMAWKMELREKIQSMPADQRKAFKKQAKAELKAMSPQQRQQRLAELDKHWSSLSPDEQQKLMNKANKGGKHHKGDKGNKANKANRHKGGSDDDDNTTE